MTAATMPMEPGQHHRSTRAENQRLIEHGIFDDKRVERIERDIVAMTPMLSPHATALGLIQDALTPIVGTSHIVRVQMPLSLGQDASGHDSDPEPDLAVVAGTRRDYATGHPTTALLVIEIADSALRYDRTRKTSVYARAPIADYWIVNLVERQIEIFRRPEPVPDAHDAWRYGERTIAQPGESVSPLALPTAVIAVSDVLP